MRSASSFPLILAAFGLLPLSTGCELITSLDHNKIPGNGGSSSSSTGGNGGASSTVTTASTNPTTTSGGGEGGSTSSTTASTTAATSSSTSTSTGETTSTAATSSSTSTSTGETTSTAATSSSTSTSTGETTSTAATTTTSTTSTSSTSTSTGEGGATTTATTGATTTSSTGTTTSTGEGGAATTATTGATTTAATTTAATTTAATSTSTGEGGAGTTTAGAGGAGNTAAATTAAATTATTTAATTTAATTTAATTTAATTTAATTTSSTTGGGPECFAPGDCAAQTCMAASCIANTCQYVAETPETACGTDEVCDGSGNCIACLADADCSTNPCVIGTCHTVTGDDVKNSCTTASATINTHCNTGGGNFCDGNGTCVECTDDAQCAAPDVCATGGVCAAPSCTDSEQDGDETDLNCGGGSFDGDTACPPCGTGLKCLVAADCASLNCNSTSLTCVAATCSDGIQNQGETDKDCGGPNCVGTCGHDQVCSGNADCKGGLCSGGLCAATCTDGSKDSLESDVDCGGGTCPVCADNSTCAVPSDCASGVCTGTICQPASCTDGVQNEFETSIDCGGPCGECTVLLISAGVSSTLGGEFHPETGSWTTTSLGGQSVDGLSLTFLTDESAVGLMRFTLGGDSQDNQIQSTSWAKPVSPATTGTWSAFATIDPTILSFNAPSVSSESGGANAAYLGTDKLYYGLDYSGTWSTTAVPALPSGGGAQSSGVAAPSFNAYVDSMAFIGDDEHLYVQGFDGTNWSVAVEIDDPVEDVTIQPTLVGALSTSDDDEMAVYVTTDNQIRYVINDAGAWGAPAAIVGATTNAPVALTRIPGGGVLLAFLGTDSHIYYTIFTAGTTYATGTWAAAAPFSTPNVTALSEPALTHGVGAAAAEIAFIETDGTIYHSRFISGTWTTPAGIGVSSGSGHVALASYPFSLN